MSSSRQQSKESLQWVIAPTEPIEKYCTATARTHTKAARRSHRRPHSRRTPLLLRWLLLSPSLRPDTLGQRLGQPGQFGYAGHAVHKTQPGVERAVKVISKARFTRHADIKFHFEQLRSEIKVMQKVRPTHTHTHTHTQRRKAGNEHGAARRCSSHGRRSLFPCALALHFHCCSRDCRWIIQTSSSSMVRQRYTQRECNSGEQLRAGQSASLDRIALCCASHLRPLMLAVSLCVTVCCCCCCCLSEVFESASDIYLVMEVAQGGELFDRIKDAGAFSEKQASSILRQMCEGLNYMSVRADAPRDKRSDWKPQTRGSGRRAAN